MKVSYFISGIFLLILATAFSINLFSKYLPYLKNSNEVIIYDYIVFILLSIAILFILFLVIFFIIESFKDEDH
jgi:hypothetical protein